MKIYLQDGENFNTTWFWNLCDFLSRWYIEIYDHNGNLIAKHGEKRILSTKTKN